MVSSFLVAFVPYVAKKKFGRKRHKTHKRRTCYDVCVQLEDGAVTVYSGTPGGHTTKGTKLAKKSRPMRGAERGRYFGVRRKRSGSPLWRCVVMSNQTYHWETSQSAATGDAPRGAGSGLEIIGALFQSAAMIGMLFTL
jgi:hypothetical protein